MSEVLKPFHFCAGYIFLPRKKNNIILIEFFIILSYVECEWANWCYRSQQPWHDEWQNWKSFFSMNNDFGRKCDEFSNPNVSSNQFQINWKNDFSLIAVRKSLLATCTKHLLRACKCFRLLHNFVSGWVADVWNAYRRHR